MVFARKFINILTILILLSDSCKSFKDIDWSKPAEPDGRKEPKKMFKKVRVLSGWEIKNKGNFICII